MKRSISTSHSRHHKKTACRFPIAKSTWVKRGGKVPEGSKKGFRFLRQGSGELEKKEEIDYATLSSCSSVHDDKVEKEKVQGGLVILHRKIYLGEKLEGPQSKIVGLPFSLGRSHVVGESGKRKIKKQPPATEKGKVEERDSTSLEKKEKKMLA